MNLYLVKFQYTDMSLGVTGYITTVVVAQTETEALHKFQSQYACEEKYVTCEQLKEVCQVYHITSGRY